MTRPRVDDIKLAILAEYGMLYSELTGASRRRSLAHPRQLAMYLARQMTGRGYAEIGHLFGGRDHSTVWHAVTCVRERLADDVTWRNSEARVRARIERMIEARDECH